MKKEVKTFITTIIRVAVILAAAFVAMVGIFSVPNDGLPMVSWTYAFMLPKIIGFMAAYAVCRLYAKWRKTDRFFVKLDEWCADAE